MDIGRAGKNQNRFQGKSDVASVVEGLLSGEFGFLGFV
jgi:hypothetical protein